MPRGGKRDGAGRPAGSAQIKTREIADRAAEQGLLPLEVMLDNMRFYHSEAYRLVAKLIAGVMPEHLAQGDEAEPDAPKEDQPHANVIEAIGQVLRLRKLAGEEAARAAPYMHPRMGYASDVASPHRARARETTHGLKVAATEPNWLEREPEPSGPGAAWLHLKKRAAPSSPRTPFIKRTGVEMAALRGTQRTLTPGPI